MLAPSLFMLGLPNDLAVQRRSRDRPKGGSLSVRCNGELASRPVAHTSSFNLEFDELRYPVLFVREKLRDDCDVDEYLSKRPVEAHVV
jgi:hypothetical protein